MIIKTGTKIWMDIDNEPADSKRSLLNYVLPCLRTFRVLTPLFLTYIRVLPAFAPYLRALPRTRLKDKYWRDPFRENVCQ